MKQPKMWRQRYIPYEIVDTSKDQVIYRDDNVLVIKWDVLHPRDDFQKGLSYVLIDKGFKISKHLKSNGEFVKYYCDIIQTEYNEENDEYIFKDILIDIVIMPDGQVIVLDEDEVDEALEQGLITKEQKEYALNKRDELLEIINNGQFPPKEMLKYIE